jgi:hypothetical protein
MSKNLNVLFVTRPTVFSGPGGDTIQLEKTANYLKSHRVTVHVASESHPDLAGYDLVHFFNLRNPQDLLHNVRRTREIRIPSVLSTIWGSYLECDIKTRTGLGGLLARHTSESNLEYFKAVARAVKNRNFRPEMLSYFLTGHLTAQREIAETVTVLLPR